MYLFIIPIPFCSHKQHHSVGLTTAISTDKPTHCTLQHSTNTNIRSPTITKIPTKTRHFQTSRRVDWSSVPYLTIYQKTRRNTQKTRLLKQGYINVPQTQKATSEFYALKGDI